MAAIPPGMVNKTNYARSKEILMEGVYNAIKNIQCICSWYERAVLLIVSSRTGTENLKGHFILFEIS